LRCLAEIRRDDHSRVQIASVPLIIGGQKWPSSLFITRA
jgi:hypothetical protein